MSDESNPRPTIEEYMKIHPVAPEYAVNLLNIEYTEEELTAAVRDIASRINKDYRELANAKEGIVLVGVLKGCMMFFGQLMRFLTIPVETEFIAVSSYEGTESTSNIVLKKDVSDELIKNKHVIIIEDLIDTGHTLEWLINHLKHKETKSVKLVTLLDKKERRKVQIDIDYVGLQCPNKFVIGYGMDFNELYRNIPFLAVLKPEAYQKKAE